MKIAVLDHGYIQLIEAWGSDERIIEAARMSTDKGFLGWGPKHDESCPARWNFLSERPKAECECTPKAGDEKLLRYLYEHKHSTPFEMAGMTIEVQAPIMVFREWHRHRTQSYSELSARYTPLPDVNYMPSIERLMNVGGTNKQAQGLKSLELSDAAYFRDALRAVYVTAQNTYEMALGAGIPKELARLCIPVGRYSRMRASANLRNWLLFLTLRMAPNAQWEIRQYANEAAKLVAQQFPRTYALFAEGEHQ
jgi:thymidylate synthase (FAD)